MYKKPLNYLFFGLSLFISGGVVHAQSAVPAPIQYVVSPQTPGPNTQVTIEVQGVGSFVGDATITWSQNGKVVSSGVGQRDFTFTTGALGSQTRVHVQVSSATEGTLTQDWVFIPSAVNLVWEADTSVPPLYKGKALYSGGSTVKVVAFPSIIVNGKSIAASSLSFQWTLDSDPVPSQSGLGKNTLTFTGSQLQKEEDVAVDMYYGASKVGHGEIAIAASNPMLVLYDKDPLRGLLFDSALPASGISLSSQEITVQAVPYFFANSSIKSGALTYAWTLNGNDTTGPNAAQGQLTLRQTGSGSGAAQIGASLQNTDSDKLVQAANAALYILFGAQSGTNLFGL